ncbi:unnamed protein product [Leptospira phage LE1]|uniref:Uncharacterized protein n=1 Tax=Leptospira phage LE1 TaxID=137511 RepID=Q6NDZ0_9CAUD|nr:hypothetical protein HWD53_gp53 [Leptospira phage LE1]CAE14746.1 unnamed protein product [Leptospira phage LE1]
MKPFLIFIFLLCACSTPPKKIEYSPSSQTGCIKIQEVKARLTCIGRLVKQLEGIHNAVISVEVENLERIDSEYVNTKETYCFTSQDTGEKYLCFETQVAKYDPTTLGKIYSFGVKFGFGFLFGIVTGIGISN